MREMIAGRAFKATELTVIFLNLRSVKDQRFERCYDTVRLYIFTHSNSGTR
jgi:hypothetical protein